MRLTLPDGISSDLHHWLQQAFSADASEVEVSVDDFGEARAIIQKVPRGFVQSLRCEVAFAHDTERCGPPPEEE